MAFRRQVKNFVKNYSDAEIKVREATSNDPWGPSSSLMLAISDLTFNAISLSEIMSMLWQRLHDHGKNWRHVYKSLTLMDYLIKNGSKKVIQHCREGFCNLQMLKDFQHVDEAGKDQGHYIREKSKQVITLLMDEQLLCKEREVACRTRRRTSYSMTFPHRLPGTGNTPTACASALTPESPASEKKLTLLKVASLRNKKNASKAGSKPEQCQDIPLPAGTALSKAWKSSEDLMLFCDEEPKPLLPAVLPISSAAWLSEGEEEFCNLCAADGYTPSGRSPSLQANVNSGKRSAGTLIKAVTESPSQTPQEEQTAKERVETFTTLSACGTSTKEEMINLNFRLAESDSTSRHQSSSVETLYVSPSFRTFTPVMTSMSAKECQKPVPPSATQTEHGNGTPSATGVSPTCEGKSSFYPLSTSSTDSVSPEKSAHCLPLVWDRPSFWTLSRLQASSISFKHRDKVARVHHPFNPRGPISSDEEEHTDLNLLESLPDISNSTKKMSPALSSDQVEFSTQTVEHLPSKACAAAQTTEGLPRDPESSSSIRALLSEVKSAIVRLHEDLRLVIQELSVINSHLGHLSGNSLQASKSLQDPQASEGSSHPI